MTKEQHQHITASEGYFALGMFEDAHAELDLAMRDPEIRMEATVRKLELFIHERRWQDVAIYAEALCDLEPEEPDHFMNHACALNALGRPEEAINALLRGPECLEDEATYHFSLGTYEAAAGDVPEAVRHLKRAFKMDRKIHEIALRDPDLAFLHDLLPPLPDPDPEPDRTIKISHDLPF